MRWHAAALLGMSPAVWGMNPDGGDHWGLLPLAVGVVLAAWVGSRSRRRVFGAPGTSLPVMPGIKVPVFAISAVLTILIFLVSLPLWALFQGM